jgi:mannose-6-phosphate isomerase
VDALPPLLLRPHYVAKPWGGRRLETDLARRDLPEGPVGESWEAADTDAVRSVVDGGMHDGRLLRDVLGAPFPLLLKVLDAREDLSVQLHPDGTGGVPAKEEAWVALADGGAVAVGDVAARIASGASLPADGTWLEHLGRQPLAGGRPERGAPPTMLHVPPGTVHSILAGALLFEVQNPVDVTWRLDDFGRAGIDGRPRALHHREAADALARGAPAAATPTDDGCRLRGERFGITLLAPGRHEAVGGAAAFFRAAGALDWAGGARFEVPAGRTVVLPPTLEGIESRDWTIVVG